MTLLVKPAVVVPVPPEVIGRALPKVREPNWAAAANKFVELAVEAKKLVVVALVPVAFVKVRSWRVDEPVRRRFESVVRPAVAVSVPVKLAAEEIV